MSRCLARTFRQPHIRRRYLAVFPNRWAAIYLEALPTLTSGRAKLLGNKRMVAQFAQLERRTSPSGKDRIDHPDSQHDEIANAVAGALVEANTRRGMIPKAG
jgi:hypothetical protein